MKKCNKCFEMKDEASFGINRKNKDGMNYYCKECLKEYRKEFKESLNSSAREYMRLHSKDFEHIIRNRFASITQKSINSKHSKKKCSENPQNISYLKKKILLKMTLEEFRTWMTENRELFESFEFPVISRIDQTAEYSIDNLEIISRDASYLKRTLLNKNKKLTN